jgi:hypothetical protein
MCIYFDVLGAAFLLVKNPLADFHALIWLDTNFCLRSKYFWFFSKGLIFHQDFLKGH